LRNDTDIRRDAVARVLEYRYADEPDASRVLAIDWMDTMRDAQGDIVREIRQRQAAELS